MTAVGHRREGFVLVLVLISMALIALLASGAAVATSHDTAAGSALVTRLALVRAAESAVVTAAADLAERPSWAGLPAAGGPSRFVDGAPGTRTIGNHALDLVGETALRTCEGPAPCSLAATTTSSTYRPWGPMNPRWSLFAHLPLATLDPVAGALCACYLMAWVADDPADADGDPTTDAPSGLVGHGVLLLRGAAVGSRGEVAEVEAVVARPCARSGGSCVGIRVQSWRTVGPSLP